MRLLSEWRVSNGYGVVGLLELRRWQVQFRHRPIHSVHKCVCRGPLLGFGRDLVSELCDGQVLNRLGVVLYLVWRGEVSNRHRRLELRRLWGRDVLHVDRAIDVVLRQLRRRKGKWC